MIVYALQRLLGLVPVLFGISVVIFLTMKLIPGDVARALLGPMATDQTLAQLRHALGLDEAIHVQYVKWLWRALHGDLGLSPIVHKPVVELLLPKFGNTLILAGASFFLAVVGGVAVGVLAASRQQTVVDRAAMGASLVVGNMPPFWLGLVLIVFFAINLRWLPSLGMYSARGPGGIGDLLAHLIMPAVATAAASQISAGSISWNQTISGRSNPPHCGHMGRSPSASRPRCSTIRHFVQRVRRKLP